MDTFGWDTVAVITTDEVNRQLAAHRDELLLDLEADPGTEPPILARGRLSSWKIVPGGGGQLIYLALAIETGTLSIGAGTSLAEILGVPHPSHDGSDAVPEDYDLAGATVVVALDLRLMPQVDSPEQELVFRLERAGNSLPPPGEGYVTPVTVLDGPVPLPVAAKSLLGYAVATDLVKRADRVKYIFGRVNPVPPGVDSWLAPTASTYAYAARETGVGGALAILSMTGGRIPSGLHSLLDPGTLRGSASASYVISREMILRHVLLPVLPSAYATTPDSFRFDSAGPAIREARRFTTFPVTSGLITYHPEITAFDMRILGDTLRTSIRGECDMGADIRMQFTVDVVNPARFDARSKTLHFAPDSNPTSSHSADIPWYLWLFGPLVIAITEICVAVISSNIADKLTNLVRTVLSIIRNPPRIVNWTGTAGFRVHSAGLDSALYMMGETVDSALAAKELEELPAAPS